jgi:hypothetical protein
MSTAFGGNQVGSRVSLDIAGSYPTGLMAALGTSYNDQQLLINAQLRYTATQVDLNSQQNSAYASYNIEKERTATIAATSLENQIAAIDYANASSRVNYVNQSLSDDANTAYTRANAIYKHCCDASYSANLSVEAAGIVIDKINKYNDVGSVGLSIPNLTSVRNFKNDASNNTILLQSSTLRDSITAIASVNPYDTTTLSHITTLFHNFEKDASNNIVLAQSNSLQFLIKTQTILATAIIKSRTVTTNLSVVLAFNTLVKSLIKTLADPLHYIAGKELLVTQYVPDVPLNNALDVTNTALTSLNAFISAISLNQNTSASIISGVNAAGTLASTLDGVARINDRRMHDSDATINFIVKSASTMRYYGAALSFPNEYTLSPTQIYTDAIKVGEEVRKFALHADISAVNARAVSDALIYLKAQFLQNTTPDSTISLIASNSLNLINTAMESVRKVTSNSSAYSAVAITLRASNTINGILAKITEQETVSLQAYSDANSVLTLLNTALSATVIPDVSHTQSAAWAVNAATERARQVSELAKDRAVLLTRTAHTIVTPQIIAVQTASANRASAINNNHLSRLDRNSRNPLFELKAFKPFQAEIRAQTLEPIRPSLDELVFKNRITPLVPNSIRSITDTKVKVAQQVQRIKSASGHSYTQQ